jgi:cell division protein FtsN
VRDVVMDGVSTMENYHAQFLRVVRDASWQELVRLVRAKVGAPAGIVQVAAPTAAPSPPAPAPVVASLSPPEIDRFVAAERQALARDVAAVVTPGLAVPDVTSAGPPRSRREVAAVAPPPTVAAVAPLRPIEPPASVMTPAAARPNPAPRVWIQVGAFKNPTMAGRVAEQVDGLILVVAPRGRAEPLLRVRVGPFPDRAHAAARLREIQSLGYRAFIIAAGD